MGKTLKLEEKLKAFTDEGEALNKEREQLVEQGKVINKRLSEIQARGLQLQGSYQAVKDLMAEKPEPVIEEVKPKK